VPNDSCFIISFLCWFAFGMLLLGKTKKKHPGDFPPMVINLPPPAQPKIVQIGSFFKDADSQTSHFWPTLYLLHHTNMVQPFSSNFMVLAQKHGHISVHTLTQRLHTTQKQHAHCTCLCVSNQQKILRHMYVHIPYLRKTVARVLSYIHLLLALPACVCKGFGCLVRI